MNAMTALYVGAAGTLIFLTLIILTFTNKRFGTWISFWKYPAFYLPFIVCGWMLVTHLYIPLKGVGCSFAVNKDIIQPENVSANKKSGVLMFYLDGFEDCTVAIEMNNGKKYTAKSLNNIFAIILPSDSGRVKEILVGAKKDTIPSGINFLIRPGKLTYLGSFIGPKGFALFIPALATKSADYTYKTPGIAQLELLKKWAINNRLTVIDPIREHLKELQRNHDSASQMVGMQFGYLPFNSTSLNGKTSTMTPDEVKKEYQDYQFMIGK